jgi:guanosine-3',5'-bis(diphosphate) 3'-pyrophosphohydrolase
MVDTARLLQAAYFAAMKHRDQRRKDAESSPYINHPLAVANVLATEAGINDETILIAALLHDTVEDTETTFEELEYHFDPSVSRLVEEVTDDKQLPKAVRKELQIKRAPTASEGARQLKIADKICNVRDIASSPPAKWSDERKVEYLEWATRVVKGCRGVNAALDQLYDKVVKKARVQLGICDECSDV